jgi:hypothetical protein
MNEPVATRQAKMIPQATANRFLARRRIFPAGVISHSIVSGDKEVQHANRMPALRMDKIRMSTKATNQ